MILARGRKELLKHRDGKRLTLKEAVLGKCYECMCCYADGKNDCKVPDCPLYGYMPYAEGFKNRFKARSSHRAAQTSDTTAQKGRKVLVGVKVTSKRQFKSLVDGLQKLELHKVQGGLNEL